MRFGAADVLVVVPAVLVLGGGLALMLLAAPRTLLAARVWGGPSNGPGPHALHVDCVRRMAGVEDLVPRGSLTLTVRSAAEESPYDAMTYPIVCGHDGTALVTLPSTMILRSPLALTVEEPGRVWARGHVSVPLATWLAGTRFRPAQTLSSPSRWVLNVDSGALVLGRPTLVHVEPIEPSGVPASSPEPPEVEAFGAELRRPFARRRSGWSFVVTATFPNAFLSLESANQGAVRLVLPVVAGATELVALRWNTATDVATPPGLYASFRSPQGKAQTYVHVEDDTGSRAIGRVMLRREGLGESAGDITLALPVLGPNGWLVVSSEPDATDERAIGWPLPPLPDQRDATNEEADEPTQRDGRVVPDVLWLDGLPAQVQAEKRRTRRGVGALAGFLGAGTLSALGLLVMRVRKAKFQGRAQLHAAGWGDMFSPLKWEEKSNGRRLLFAILTLLFGGAVVGWVLSFLQLPSGNGDNVIGNLDSPSTTANHVSWWCFCSHFFLESKKMTRV